MTKLMQDFDTTSAAVCKLFDRIQTKFAARKGSTFLYFKFVRQNSGEGCLYAYTKDCREMSVLVNAYQMRSFVAAPTQLRGQAFGKLYASSGKLSRHTLKVDAAEVVSNVNDLNKAVDFPMPKSSQFAKFSVQTKHSIGTRFADSSYLVRKLSRSGVSTCKTVSASELTTLIEHYAKVKELTCPDTDRVLEALSYA